MGLREVIAGTLAAASLTACAPKFSPPQVRLPLEERIVRVEEVRAPPNWLIMQHRLRDMVNRPQLVSIETVEEPETPEYVKELRVQNIVDRMRQEPWLRNHTETHRGNRLPVLDDHPHYANIVEYANLNNPDHISLISDTTNLNNLADDVVRGVVMFNRVYRERTGREITTVIVDKGHGQLDPGNIKEHDGVTYVERDFVNYVAPRLAEALRKRGFEVPPPLDYDESTRRIARRGRSDTGRRVYYFADMATELGDVGSTIYLGTHFDARADRPRCRGFRICSDDHYGPRVKHHPASSWGRVLARHIAASMMETYSDVLEEYRTLTDPRYLRQQASASR